MKSVREIIRDFNLGDTPKEYVDKHNKKIGLINLKELGYQKVIGFNYNAKKNIIIIKLNVEK